MSKEVTIKVNLGKPIGFGLVLSIVFVVLKVFGVVAWPWIWVISPLWISLAASLILLAIMWGIMLLIMAFRRN